jgi:hypothetical protein
MASTTSTTDERTTSPNAAGADQGETAADTTADQAADTTAPETDDASDQAPDGKTYTQEELNAIVNARIARARKATAREVEERLKAERERAGMDEAERVKAEMADREKDLTALRDENRRLKIANQLAGKVVNVDDAVRLIDDDLIDDDGVLDVNTFLESRPYLRADNPKAGSRAAPGNPPASKRLTRDQIASMSEKEIESRWDEVKAVLDG